MNNSRRSIMSSEKVAILMCTFQGERFLVEQLESIERQTHQNWVLWVSDDGSKDGTLDILKYFAKKWGKGKLILLEGPRRGFNANFLSLACNSNVNGDYFCFADQDDIWVVNKLERGIAFLNASLQNIPLMYCSRTELINECGDRIGFSPLFAKPPSFANALVQNIAGGNTMMFNGRARALLTKAGADTFVVFYDWWLYLLVTGWGGIVFYDSRCSVLYRQHSINEIGVSADWWSRMRRLRDSISGRRVKWSDANLAALNALSVELSLENRKTLNHFISAKRRPVFARLISLKKSGAYAQTSLGCWHLFLTVLIGRL